MDCSECKNHVRDCNCVPSHLSKKALELRLTVARNNYKRFKNWFDGLPQDLIDQMEEYYDNHPQEAAFFNEYYETE